MPPTRPSAMTMRWSRARAGDRPAFGELVRRHQRSAVRVAAVISGSTEEAYDIVQGAFVNMHRHLGTYDGRGPVRSWMLRVVANHARTRCVGGCVGFDATSGMQDSR
ncbi:MAG: sigma factor [Ilumatobacteraceae bacterium]